jgi:hypothetical protein
VELKAQLRNAYAKQTQAISRCLPDVLYFTVPNTFCLFAEEYYLQFQYQSKVVSYFHAQFGNRMEGMKTMKYLIQHSEDETTVSRI